MFRSLGPGTKRFRREGGKSGQVLNLKGRHLQEREGKNIKKGEEKKRRGEPDFILASKGEGKRGGKKKKGHEGILLFFEP